MFQALGIIELMGLENRRTIQDPLVKGWYIYRGTDVDFGDEYEEFDSFLKDCLKDEDKHFAISTGISEAVTNVKQHAYDSGEPKLWWAFAKRDEETDVLAVIICDAGISIPTSFENFVEINFWNVKDLLRHLGYSGARKDGDILQAALELGQSNTGLPYRGKGLPQIRDISKQIPGTDLKIFSRKAIYSLVDGEEKRTSRRKSIDGTIIHWNVPLASSESSVN
ncbi:Uncharacterised protein [BD1-7 clade bacterium]|nr:Uncharacterised protein [BD1-7 clade bacterium]